MEASLENVVKTVCSSILLRVSVGELCNIETVTELGDKDVKVVTKLPGVHAAASDCIYAVEIVNLMMKIEHIQAFT